MSKAIAKTQDKVPSYLKDHKVEKQDNFDGSDVAIPQVKLLQGTSEQVTIFDDAKVGNFWHTGLDIPLGPSVSFIVCSRRKKYLLQAPLDDGQGVLARADDAKTWNTTGEWEVLLDKKHKIKTTWKISDLDVERSGLDEWGTYNPELPGSPPAATLFYDYLVILPDHLDAGPAVISLARSAIKKAKKGLNDKIALHMQNNRPMQALMFAAEAVAESGDSGDFHNWQFMSNGFVSEELFNQANKIAEQIPLYTVQGEGEYDERVPSGAPDRDDI